MFLNATDITATDADVGNANDDIVGIFEGWDRSILKTGFAGAIEDTREILTGHETREFQWRLDSYFTHCLAHLDSKVKMVAKASESGADGLHIDSP